MKYYHSNRVHIPTSPISWGHISQGQDVCTLGLTLRVVRAGKKLFQPLDLSVDIKTILLIADNLSCFLCLSLPLLLAAEGLDEDPVMEISWRVRKGEQLLATCCNYRPWEKHLASRINPGG